MSKLGNLIQWFSGGPDGYMTLMHCMKGDSFWITLTVCLDLGITLGYILIARHWWENEKSLPASQAKLALGNMKRIFLFCGICGYLFIPIKMFWPAWRLYDLFMVGLVFYTWRYALNARQLRVVYHELGRTKQLAFELEESRAESKRKSFFLNAVSHDLRTPLNGLMLQTELAELSASSDDAESLREALREIKVCARTTADLLDSFLELGRLDWSDDPNRESRFFLNQVLGPLVTSARLLGEKKGLEVWMGLTSDFVVHTDRIKLERIIQNLLSNAIKFTRQGRIELSVARTGRDLMIHVSDTGAGIPEAELSTIFEVFFQLSNSERDRNKGFGLGLSIARRLARQLGGDLVVESELERGSRFSLILPGVVDESGTGSPAAVVSGTTTSATLG